MQSQDKKNQIILFFNTNPSNLFLDAKFDVANLGVKEKWIDKGKNKGDKTVCNSEIKQFIQRLQNSHLSLTDGNECWTQNVMSSALEDRKSVV